MKDLLESGTIGGQQAVLEFNSSSKRVKLQRSVPTLMQHSPMRHP